MDKTKETIIAEASRLAVETGQTYQAYVLLAVDAYNQAERARLKARDEGMEDIFGEGVRE